MPRTRVGAEQRQLVAERARGRCEYCQSPAAFATQSFSVEHLLPVSRGGETISENLALACPGCNSHKYTKIEAPDPINGAPTPLYHPRSQRWKDHFGWDDGFTRVIGLTPTGRATVNALQMNRPGIRNMRHILFVSGLHPPAEEQ